MGIIQAQIQILKMGQEIIIRSALSQDAAHLIHLSHSVMAEGGHVLTTSEEFQVTVEEEVRWIEAYASDPNKIVLVAEVAGLIVGMLDFKNGMRKRLAHQGEFGMSVHKDWRGLGIGKALLQALVHWGQANPAIEQIRLAVLSNNEPAIRLYTSLGFVQEGRLMNQAKLSDGSYCDLLLMVKSVK